MSNELVAAAGSKGLMGMMTSGLDAFSNAASEKGVRNGAYLNFNGQIGKWTCKGQDVDEGTAFAFHIWEAKRGFVAWKNKKPVEEVLVPFRGGVPPKVEELTDHWIEGKSQDSDGWSEVIRIDVRDLEGGPQMDCTLKADQPYRPVWQLIKDYGEKAKINLEPDGKTPKIPVVEIGVEKVNGKRGTFFAPTLKIVDWLSQADMDERVEDYVSANGGDVTSDEVVHETNAPVTLAAPKMGVRK